MINLPLLISIVTVAVPVGAAAWALSTWLTGWSIRLAESRNLVAEINERSSHRVPTPRVGGIGLIAGLMVAYAVLAAMILFPGSMPAMLAQADTGFLTWGRWLGLLLPVLLAFGLGFWDDQSDPPALAKLAGQILIAFLPPILGVRLDVLTLPGTPDPIALPIWLSIPLSAIWILLVMNAVNFMDGINGLAGTFGRRIAIFFFLACFNLMGWETMVPLCAALYGASTGFLRWNVPQARTFMGDCGSQPLGVLAALLSLQLASIPTTYPLPFLAAVMILSVFLFDVLFTLSRRSVRGENVLKAHREHLYQRYLISREEDHAATLRFVDMQLILTGICGAATARLFPMPAHGGLQIGLTVACGAILAMYLVTVSLREMQRSEKPK